MKMHFEIWNIVKSKKNLKVEGHFSQMKALGGAIIEPFPVCKSEMITDFQVQFWFWLSDMQQQYW